MLFPHLEISEVQLVKHEYALRVAKTVVIDAIVSTIFQMKIILDILPQAFETSLVFDINIDLVKKDGCSISSTVPCENTINRYFFNGLVEYASTLHGKFQ